MQDSQYLDYLQLKEQEYESLCKRCGACCGAFDGDPCKHLLKRESGEYYCGIYDSRLGMQKTVSGAEFLCVEIRNIMSKTWSHAWNCGYKKLIKW